MSKIKRLWQTEDGMLHESESAAKLHCVKKTDADKLAEKRIALAQTLSDAGLTAWAVDRAMDHLMHNIDTFADLILEIDDLSRSVSGAPPREFDDKPKPPPLRTRPSTQF